MKKTNKILRETTPNFRSFVVVTGFLGNIGKKPYLTTYQRAPQYEKIQNTEVQYPEISILFDCNRFFLK